MRENDSMVKPSELTHVPIDKIHRNPQNPRLIFDPKPLQILRESIDEVGILVPLLIYQRKVDGEYILLDGERRWICAKDLDLPEVPANILEEPSLIRNLLTMFNIHNVREPWELMPTALKLEVVMRELNTDSEIKLAELTGLARGNVRRCKILLTFPKFYQDMMIVVDPEQRVKADFFIEMSPVLSLIGRKLPRIAEKYDGNQLIEIFLDKYKRQKITSVLDFRKIATFIRSIDRGITKELVESRLSHFLEDKESAISECFEETDSLKQAQSLKRACTLLMRKISAFEYFSQSSDKEMRQLLIELKTLIDAKLELMQLNDT